MFHFQFRHCIVEYGLGPGRTCHFEGKRVCICFYLRIVGVGEGEITALGRCPLPSTVRPIYKVNTGSVGAGLAAASSSLVLSLFTAMHASVM